jgi:hypothetical protein
MGGVSSANFTGEFAKETKSMTTFLFGGFASMEHGDFIVQPGLIYIRKGAKDNQMDVDAKLTLDYIQIPVIVRIGMPVGDNARFYLGAGPAVGFKMGCKVKGTDQGVSVSFDCDDPDLGLPAKSTEFSAIGEAGMEFGKFAVGIRADLGLTESFKDTGDPSNTGKTKTLSLVGAIHF